MVNPRNKVHIQFIALYWCITEKHSKWLKRQLKLYFFCTKYKRSVLVRLEDNGVKHSTQALDNIWCHHYFYAFLKMALGILIKNTKKDLVWSFIKSQNKPAGLDSKRVVSRVFSLRKQQAFSLGSMAVLVGRANKPRWAGAAKLRGFLFFSVLRRSFARFCGFATQWYAQQNCHATQATHIWRRHQRFPQVTDHKCRLECRSPFYGK